MRTSFVLFLPALITCFTSCGPSTRTLASFVIEPWRSDDAPGGAVLVADGDSVLTREGFGLADLEAGAPNTPSTNFRLASVTKQFTAMSILILRDRGQLKLDDPISDFFPEGPPVWDSIRVRHLLTHTSGLVDYEDVMPETTTVPVLDRDVLRLVRVVDTTYFSVGTRYQYSNSGYALLALIVERVSGMTFAGFLRHEIFDPAGMSGTVAFEPGLSTIQQRAYGHSREDASSTGFRRTDQSMTSSVLGDGGVYSSVDDLLRWNRVLLSKRLVSHATLEEAFTPHITSDDGKVRYGYGWMIGEMEGWRTLEHSGSTIGFRNFLIRIPERSMFVVVLMNRADGPAEQLARGIASQVLRMRPRIPPTQARP